MSMIEAQATFHLLVISDNRHDPVDSFRSQSVAPRTLHVTRSPFDALADEHADPDCRRNHLPVAPCICYVSTKWSALDER